MTKMTRELTAHEIHIEENGLMDFQFSIIDALNSKEITQAEFAEKLGVSRARVSQLLSSDANPTIKLVSRALDVLGLRAEYEEIERKKKGSVKPDARSESTLCTWVGVQRRNKGSVWHRSDNSGANSNSCETMEAA